MGGFLATVGTVFIVAAVILIVALGTITDIQIGIIVCAFGFGFVLWGIAAIVWRLDESGVNAFAIRNIVTPDPAKKLGNGEWRCTCGQINKSNCTSCVCGINKRDVQR